MSVKEWFRNMQPSQLYVILFLTIIFFIIELIVSHLTHALTLLMNSYHMLCNILALTGCIITIKYGKKWNNENTLNKAESVASSIGEELKTNPAACHDKKKKTKASPSRENQVKKLKNTFGWARIDVISMLICCVFMASICFSIFVESLQTLVHIDHQDEMHHPIPVLCIGCAGLLLNGICFLLIGGYTFHQGSFLYVTESGDVVLNKVVVNEVRSGQRRLSRTRTVHPPQVRQRQGVKEMLRDVLGCILVMICSILVYISDKSVAKYIDPVFALISASSIMVLSYPYMKESCLILLQTIPNTIDINSIRTELLEHFPDIVNVHDFHVWQLTATKVISTIHIIFQNPKVYKEVIEDIKNFFTENGITQVTIQPEFFTKAVSSESLNSDKAPICLVPCQGEGCKQSHCCNQDDNEVNIRSSKEVIDPSQVPEEVKTVPDNSAEIIQKAVTSDTK